jgi:hypothetical protein
VLLKVTGGLTVIKVNQHVCQIAAKLVLSLSKLLGRLVLGLLLGRRLLLMGGRVSRRLSVRARWSLSHVLPSGVVGFVSLFDTERALFRELVFIFLLLLWLLHAILVVLIFFFSVAFLFFFAFLGIFRVGLLQNFWVQLILLFNDFLHGHDTVLDGVATDLTWAGAYF